jgi:hypothetical protein
MIYNGFKIHSVEHIHDAYCECGHTLTEVSNGLLSSALYCDKCENVYLLKKVKLAKKQLTKDFLKQCRFEVKFSEEKYKLRKELEKQLK